NTGHEGDSSYAIDHPEKIKDFGYRAAHETVVVSKALIKAYYDTPLKYSVIAEGGGGTIAALSAAQRYPEDFDVIAGSRGTEPGQFNIPHTIAIDTQNNVYVGDRENKRIQVFDVEGNFKTQYTNIGAPYAICITPGARQFLYTSNSNPSTGMDNGEIYKMTLDGKVLGKFGTAGKMLKEFGTVHELDCRSENELYVGEITNWRVQKLTLKPAQSNE